MRMLCTLISANKEEITGSYEISSCMYAGRFLHMQRKNREAVFSSRFRLIKRLCVHQVCLSLDRLITACSALQAAATCCCVGVVTVTHTCSPAPCPAIRMSVSTVEFVETCGRQPSTASPDQTPIASSSCCAREPEDSAST